MTQANPVQPAPSELDEASLDLIAGGAETASDVRRQQEQDCKATSKS